MSTIKNAYNSLQHLLVILHRIMKNARYSNQDYRLRLMTRSGRELALENRHQVKVTSAEQTKEPNYLEFSVLFEHIYIYIYIFMTNIKTHKGYSEGQIVKQLDTHLK
jgi:hypothetical protein